MSEQNSTNGAGSLHESDQIDESIEVFVPDVAVAMNMAPVAVEYVNTPGQIDESIEVFVPDVAVAMNMAPVTVEYVNTPGQIDESIEVFVPDVAVAMNMAPVSVEYVNTPGHHIDCELLYTSADRQLFKVKARSGNGIRYSCYETGCRSSVILRDGVCTHLINNHQHGNQEQKMKKFKLEHDIKVRCQNEPGRPRHIFNEECSLNEDCASQVQFGKLRRSLTRSRRRGLPQNPSSAAEVKEYFKNEVVVSRLLGNPNQSMSFYKCTVITTDFSYTLFASEAILSRVAQRQLYLIDGTFKVVPAGPFKQLLTIAVENSRHMFPTFYVLMTRRTEAAYRHLFEYLKTQWNINPSKFMSDYERALRNALRTTFNGVKVKGCFFHFTQAVRRYASQIPNFFDEIWKNEAKKKLYHKLLALPLMREDKILESFQLLKTEALGMPLEAPFKAFLIYYERQWIKREGASNICVYKELNRTNNLTESYNGHLKTLIPCHGGLYGFVEALMKEDKTRSREYNMLLDGANHIFENQRQKYATRDAHIKAVQKRFEEGTVDITTYFNQLTFPGNTGSIQDMDRYDVEDVHDIESGIDISDDEEGAVGGLIEEQHMPDGQAVQVSMLQTEVNALRNLNICVVCLTNERDTIIMPCGHVKTCRMCTENLINTVRRNESGQIVPPQCPLCRGLIENSCRAFL